MNTNVSRFFYFIFISGIRIMIQKCFELKEYSRTNVFKSDARLSESFCPKISQKYWLAPYFFAIFSFSSLIFFMLSLSCLALLLLEVLFKSIISYTRISKYRAEIMILFKPPPLSYQIEFIRRQSIFSFHVAFHFCSTLPIFD